MSGNSSRIRKALTVLSDSEYNYIPGYIIEDESNDTSHEIGTLEAVDSEILSDHDACLYADEPLANEEWYAKRKEQNKMLQRRLDGREDVKSLQVVI